MWPRGRGEDRFIVEGVAAGIPMVRMAAAGWSLEQLRESKATFDAIRPGSYDARVRLADQDTDGVAAELIYPTVGMIICGLDDLDYKNACFIAYNRWLEELCAAAPGRVYGTGCTAARTVGETIADFERIKAQGVKGVMMPPSPATDVDYDDPAWDPAWRVADCGPSA
ncbi:MAG: hypothetical protein ABW039_04755 [Sphingobium sp.]